MYFVEYADTDMLMLALAQTVSREVRAALLRREWAVLAVPGGGTPGPLFDLLSASELDWSRVIVLPGDERCVPADHPRSNAGMIRARLLRGPAAAARLVELWPADPAAIEALLPLDVALVGMGEDMHTASLFPGASALPLALAADAPALLAIEAPGASEPRITLSARVLTAAFGLHVLITGAAKRAALERAQGLLPEQAPIAALLPRATVHWAP